MHVGGIFCDLAKAFHCVCHETLLRKLHFYGIQGIAECEISSSHGGEYDVQSCPLKRWSTIILHGSITQKTALNINCRMVQILSSKQKKVKVRSSSNTEILFSNLGTTNYFSLYIAKNIFKLIPL
jgi:hypothetical protein